jgi:Tannase-like family of unknown function (DUF6351)
MVRVAGERLLHRALGLVVAILSAALLVGVGGASAHGSDGGRGPTISVLSGRADLISGGDALISIRGLHSFRSLSVRAGGKDQTSAFAHGAKGTAVGLVRGLRLGRSSVVVRDGRRAAKLRVTTHPIGGPVFSGPQLKPWKCQATALDAQCNQPPAFRYVYKSSNPAKPGFLPYDPANAPADVATTTTDKGVSVPFIVRVETGYIDRDQYQIAALFQPGKPWTPVAPQPQFNHKLVVTHGFACGADHQTGTAPAVLTGAAATALARGFATMSHALDHAGHNCNLTTEAESLVMTKEYLVERYGTLRYTIGTGCSGGSLAQQWIANAYPGVYQGILPTCSFPDAWSTASQFLDYHLSLHYLDNPSKWGVGVTWTAQQMADVQGHVGVANARVSDAAQFHVVIPTDPCAGTTSQNRYNAATNPGGVRCTIQDAAINVFGPRLPAFWGPQEKRIGRGFAGVPTDNIGVQYGLGALRSGKISAAQFVDLNVKIGGLDADAAPVAKRMTADRRALANAYRSGMINETNNLDRTAIIDCRGPDEGLFHDAYRAFALRARLDREHGGHANQLIWEGATPIIGDPQCELNSMLAMDRWLTAVEKDHTRKPLARKIARDKPADLTDRCYDGNGVKVSDALCPSVVHVYKTPRMVAGDSITTDHNKCRLKPLDRRAYGGVSFTDAQWSALRKVFGGGVCDFSKRGVDQQPTIPWQTYQNARGKVIYGGRPLGPAPRSTPIEVRH